MGTESFDGSISAASLRRLNEAFQLLPNLRSTPTVARREDSDLSDVLTLLPSQVGAEPPLGVEDPRLFKIQAVPEQLGTRLNGQLEILTATTEAFAEAINTPRLGRTSGIEIGLAVTKFTVDPAVRTNRPSKRDYPRVAAHEQKPTGHGRPAGRAWQVQFEPEPH